MKLFLNPVFWCFVVWRFSMISCEFPTNISWEMSIVCCCVNWPSVIIHRNFITFKQFSCNQWVNFICSIVTQSKQSVLCILLSMTLMAYISICLASYVQTEMQLFFSFTKVFFIAAHLFVVIYWFIHILLTKLVQKISR